MTQPLNPQTPYAQQVERFKDVSARLLTALHAHRQAKAASDSARDKYDDKRRDLITQGCPGLKDRCTADEKEAYFARSLLAEVQAVRAARDALRVAETDYEAACIMERVERETLRCMQRDMEYSAARAI